jgi:hypothetical protein
MAAPPLILMTASERDQGMSLYSEHQMARLWAVAGELPLELKKGFKFFFIAFGDGYKRSVMLFSSFPNRLPDQSNK